jgi:2,4-dienoyl-CoA reductase-like NADH-dependent reductase (Old Yellow Enzyme family)
MSTVAYCTPSPDGGTDGRQIFLGNPDATAGLERLTDAIHEEGAAACAQIGHAGPVANSRGTGHPPLAPSRRFSPLSMRFANEATTQDIERITEEFVLGTKVLAETGFDAVEIHLGHGYLLSAFLSPKLNRRRDRYGGDLPNRARFPLHVVRAVRDAAPSHMAVTAKLNMSDGTRKGFQTDESLAFARMLEEDGSLDALVLTAGSSLENPMYLFRGDAPTSEMAETMPPTIRFGFRLMARRFFRTYPFEEAYLLPSATQFLDALSIPVVYLGGVNRLDTIQSVLNQGFAAVAMARALLIEPDLPNRMREGLTKEGSCIHCNKCMPTIYRGTRCVLVDP